MYPTRSRSGYLAVWSEPLQEDAAARLRVNNCGKQARFSVAKNKGKTNKHGGKGGRKGRESALILLAAIPALHGVGFLLDVVRRAF